MAKINTDQKTWAQLSGKVLGNITAIWFAFAIATVVLVPPTKGLVSLITWFWHLW